MKYFKVIKTPYSYKFDSSNEELEINIVFNYNKKINKIKSFLATKNFLAETKILDYTEDPSLKFDVYYIDKMIDNNNVQYLSEYIDHILNHGEYLNVSQFIKVPNVYETIRRKILKIKPIDVLEDNKIYAIIDIKPPISSIIYQSHIMPICYIDIYGNLIKYNSSYIRFYKTDDNNSFKYIYPPITILPHIKNIILENLYYNKLYNEYYFSIDVYYSIENSLGSSIMSCNNVFRFKYVYGMNPSIKSVLEKSVLEFIFSLKNPKYNQ